MAIPAVLIGAVAKSAGLFCPKFHCFARKTDWVPGTPGALHDKGRGECMDNKGRENKGSLLFLQRHGGIASAAPPLLR